MRLIIFYLSLNPLNVFATFHFKIQIKWQYSSARITFSLFCHFSAPPAASSVFFSLFHFFQFVWRATLYAHVSSFIHLCIFFLFCSAVNYMKCRIFWAVFLFLLFFSLLTLRFYFNWLVNPIFLYANNTPQKWALQFGCSMNCAIVKKKFNGLRSEANSPCFELSCWSYVCVSFLWEKKQN